MLIRYGNLLWIKIHVSNASLDKIFRTHPAVSGSQPTSCKMGAVFCQGVEGWRRGDNFPPLFGAEFEKLIAVHLPTIVLLWLFMC
jgi:hypothetical protein